jgi:hypothetical protein
MGQRKLLRWSGLGGAVVILLLAGPAAVPASTGSSACGNHPACNDNYLTSLELNKAGTRLNRTKTIEDTEDTSTATAQNNIFNPCGAGQTSCPSGPPETTSCNGTGYGKTIWYDFYPDAAGKISIRTFALFPNVVTLYTFNNNQNSVNFLLPTKKQCTVATLGGGQLVAPVKRGVAYTFQIGGVDTSQGPTGAGGQVQMKFDYFPTPPRRLSANATLTAAQTSNGIQVLGLSVSTARAATVSVDCGGFCHPQSKTKSATETFPSLKGVRLPAGSTLTIRVTAKHSIGVLIQYHVVKGNFHKQTFCTEPGSRKPRTSCR